MHVGRDLNVHLQQTPNTEIQQRKWRFEVLFLAGPALVAVAGVHVFWGVLFQLVQLFFSAGISIFSMPSPIRAWGGWVVRVAEVDPCGSKQPAHTLLLTRQRLLDLRTELFLDHEGVPDWCI